MCPAAEGAAFEASSRPKLNGGDHYGYVTGCRATARARKCHQLCGRAALFLLVAACICSASPCLCASTETWLDAELGLLVASRAEAGQAALAKHLAESFRREPFTPGTSKFVAMQTTFPELKSQLLPSSDWELSATLPAIQLKRATDTSNDMQSLRTVELPISGFPHRSPQQLDAPADISKENVSAVVRDFDQNFGTYFQKMAKKSGSTGDRNFLKRYSLLLDALSGAILYLLGKLICGLICREKQQISWLARWTFLGLLDGAWAHFFYHCVSRFVMYMNCTSHLEVLLIGMAASAFIYGPVYCVVFLVLMSLLDGQGFKGAARRLRADFVEMLQGTITTWAIFNLYLFNFVPPSAQASTSMAMHFLFLVGLALWDSGFLVLFKKAEDNKNAPQNEGPEMDQPEEADKAVDPSACEPLLAIVDHDHECAESLSPTNSESLSASMAQALGESATFSSCPSVSNTRMETVFPHSNSPC